MSTLSRLFGCFLHVLGQIRSQVHNMHIIDISYMIHIHSHCISYLDTHLSRHLYVFIVYVYTHIYIYIEPPTPTKFLFQLNQEDWMLWFHAAVVWFVVLISAWQKLGQRQCCFFLPIGDVSEVLIVMSHSLRFSF